MVRRNAPSHRSLIYWFGAPIAIVAIVACSGYMSGNDYFDAPMCPSDEDGYLAIPKECCPCPWPDMCPNGWPEVPAHCRTGCEPGQPIECCECPTEAWCTKEAGQHFKEPEFCKSKSWLNDGGVDASSAICPRGTCVPKTPEGWLGPATLYEGFDINADPCPEGVTTWEGMAKPEALGCAECACSTPLSICKFSPPWTVSSRGCDDFENGVKWNFDPPADWDGTCNNDKSLPAGKLCGTEGLCAKSITIYPPKIEQIDTSCTPFVNKEELPPPKLHKGASLTPAGRVCIDKQAPTNLPTCGVDDKDFCVSTPGPGPACIAREGDNSCPAGWPQRHIFYKDIKDNRTCSECSCGPVEGANCERKYRLFTDSTCSAEYGSWITYDTSLPQCQWLVEGTAIGSKMLDTVEETLGACKPYGGEVTGELKLNDPFTVCCAATDM